MAVNLSPVGGAAAQFFDDNGEVLTGGFLYTYVAGTTTPAVTYTQSNGLTAQPNPIVLNAAGRVPDSGEIWLTDGVNYKFILKDQGSVLISTSDNISGINSSSGQQGYATATQGQTIVTTPFSYTVGVNALKVYVNGNKQIVVVNYTETSVSTVTFLTGLNVGDLIEFTQ